MSTYFVLICPAPNLPYISTKLGGYKSLATARRRLGNYVSISVDATTSYPQYQILTYNSAGKLVLHDAGSCTRGI